MPRRSRGLMSEALKYDLARELGVADVVYTEGWGSVSSKNCGNLVKLAVARAQTAMAARHRRIPATVPVTVPATTVVPGLARSSLETYPPVPERAPYGRIFPAGTLPYMAVQAAAAIPEQRI